MDTPRCTGHCCRGFFIDDGKSYQEVQGEYEAFLGDPDNADDPEIDVIAKMIIPLNRHDASGRELFTCRNLGEDMNCQIYETRPQMCRELGEDIPCPHNACSLEWGKAPLWKKVVKSMTRKRFSLKNFRTV